MQPDVNWGNALSSREFFLPLLVTSAAFEPERMWWTVGILSWMCPNKHWIWHQWQRPYILRRGEDTERIRRLPRAHSCCLGVRPSMHQDEKWMELLSPSYWHSSPRHCVCVCHVPEADTHHQKYWKLFVFIWLFLSIQLPKTLDIKTQRDYSVYSVSSLTLMESYEVQLWMTYYCQ